MMFKYARVKLTIKYSLAIVFMSGVVSGLIYLRTSRVIESEYERIEIRMEREKEGLRLPPMRPGFMRIQPEDLEAAQFRILNQLIWINLFIFIVVGAISYVLAGQTLKPIEEALETKKRFISDAAHELRTPLTSLKTSMEVSLLDKKLNQSVKKLVKENLLEVDRLVTLTNKLLIIDQEQNVIATSDRVILKEVIEKAIKMIKPLANKKNIKIESEIFNSKLKVRGNYESLIELMVILLDNAVKYSDNHSVIKIKVDEETKLVIIKIIDNGEGIEKDQLDKIFERFYQTDKSRSRLKNKGFGLGLALAKDIVSNHNGEIKVISKPRQGSTFEVSLPKVLEN